MQEQRRQLAQQLQRIERRWCRHPERILLAAPKIARAAQRRVATLYRAERQRQQALLLECERALQP